MKIKKSYIEINLKIYDSLDVLIYKKVSIYLHFSKDRISQTNFLVGVPIPTKLIGRLYIQKIKQDKICIIDNTVSTKSKIIGIRIVKG